MPASRARALALLAAVVFSASVFAATRQTFSARVDGLVWEGDDNTIAWLTPEKGTLNLVVATKGSANDPPPRMLADRLSITCNNFEKQPRKYEGKDFGAEGCEVTFTKGESKQPGGAPQATYKSANGRKANVFEITSVKGKVIEGRLSLELVDVKTKVKMSITEGVFKVEDRQY